MIRLSKASVGQEELEAVKEVLDLCYFGMGSKVKEFEDQVAAYLGAAYFIAVNTGTSALHLSLDAIGVGPGDEVIVPTITFIACFQAVSALGATPIACEVNPETLLMDIEDAERRITERTKAIVPVHYAGSPSDLDGLWKIKETYGIRLVEDAAHAFGSCYKGKKIGSFGDVVCFSFDGIKTITTGEGGGIACFDGALANLMRQKRLLGIDRDTDYRYQNRRTWLFEVRTQGYRYHMSNINAAIGIAQLKKVDRFIERRRALCEKYDAAFRSLKAVRTLPTDYAEVAPHIYVIRVLDGRRDDLVAYLNAREIETGIHYVPNHMHSLYRVEGTRLAKSEQAYGEVITLPLHVELSDEDQLAIIRAVHECFE